MNESAEKKEAKFSHDFEKLRADTVSGWVYNWLSDLIRANNQTPNTHMIIIGIGRTTQIFRRRNDFLVVDEATKTKIVKAYNKAKNRLILLDNEGTLGPCDPWKGSEFRETVLELSESASKILQLICSDPSNTVCVISGRKCSWMKKKFGHIESLWIVAENGYYHGWNSKKGALSFNSIMEIKDWGWKDTVLDIMKSYQERTDGSAVTVKDSSVSWFYKNVDTDFGIKESNELVAHLHTILEYLPLDIVHGKDYVEVKPAGVDKGGFTKHLLKNLTEKKGRLDFVLCIGDSQTDEAMFKEIKEFMSLKEMDKRFFCVTVGQKVSEANHYVNDYKEAIATLADIILLSMEVLSFVRE
eukprot:TRINITY_DN15458_c0_g1_i1.p1 TRINITY_DN15458_c0_g1~~TRINITY_DN15458_c0_g1_i1.p1  ORF type:complete len:356 (+),score=110.58 TRINITY_DN15458_c0_g1_i1:1847-2914(+)